MINAEFGVLLQNLQVAKHPVKGFVPDMIARGSTPRFEGHFGDIQETKELIPVLLVTQTLALDLELVRNNLTRLLDLRNLESELVTSVPILKAEDRTALKDEVTELSGCDVLASFWTACAHRYNLLIG